ncbi:D-Ala-D-Ala carboxypeptidase family metallohydrolase [Flagellimonas sp. CMM7]|nr:D-Ala-D-Ala carboxypeptidase family metallohydrolase [Flagellimonas sp. CMM7]
MRNLELLADELQTLRNYVGKPIIISSGLRSFQHNLEVGGATHSQHLYGTAADFKAVGMTTLELANAIEHLIGIGQMKQGGLGIYDTWIHYDIRGEKARWDNRKKKAWTAS